MFESKRKFRSRRREVRELKRRIFVSSSIALCVLTLGVLVWYGARRPEVTIASVTVSGGETVPHDVVRAKAESVLTGTYGLLVPRTFSYLFPHDEIVDALNSIPRVHNAAVIRTSRTELAITYDEYVPYALWCDAVQTPSSTPACLFVDDRGYAYAEAPLLTGESLVRFVIDGRTPERNSYVYDTDTLRRYRAFAEALLTHKEHRLASIVETKEGDLMLHLSSNVDLLIRKDADIQDIFEKIESIFAAPEFKEDTLDEYAYIDLRFGNKVFLKERIAEGVAHEQGEGEGMAVTPPPNAAAATTLVEHSTQSDMQASTTNAARGSEHARNASTSEAH